MSESERDLAILYDEYYRKITGYLRRLVGEAEAEDVAQETFVKVGRSLGGFRGESSLSTWIYRIATNTALDHLRRTGQAGNEEHTGAGVDGPDNGIADLPDSDPLQDVALIRKDMNECIRGLVYDLPENYRAVVVLGDLEGLTNAEIARVLGLSLDTVKIRLHRGRLQLRKAMDRVCHLYRNDHNELSCDRRTIPLNFLKK